MWRPLSIQHTVNAQYLCVNCWVDDRNGQTTVYIQPVYERFWPLPVLSLHAASFLPQALLEHVLSARHPARCWGYWNTQDMPVTFKEHICVALDNLLFSGLKLTHPHNKTCSSFIKYYVLVICTLQDVLMGCDGLHSKDKKRASFWMPGWREGTRIHWCFIKDDRAEIYI